jgi:hypothetical protein
MMEAQSSSTVKESEKFEEKDISANFSKSPTHEGYVTAKNARSPFSRLFSSTVDEI